MAHAPRRIFVPTDFSELSRQALFYAAELALLTGGQLTLVHVTFEVPKLMPTGAVIAPARREELVRDRDAAVAAQLSDEIAVLEGRVPTNSVVGVGDPGAELIRMAAEDETELIVISSHTRKGIKRLVLGSVAEKVSRHAACPVLIVR